MLNTEDIMKNEGIKIPVPENTPLVKYSNLFGVQNLFVKDETKILPIHSKIDWPAKLLGLSWRR
ncbi:MAG: hypothetical protein Q8Q18_00730 [bacterium]|nr:hypothetical protein [bacterium]